MGDHGALYPAGADYPSLFRTACTALYCIGLQCNLTDDSER